MCYTKAVSPWISKFEPEDKWMKVYRILPDVFKEERQSSEEKSLAQAHNSLFSHKPGSWSLQINTVYMDYAHKYSIAGRH